MTGERNDLMYSCNDDRACGCRTTGCVAVILGILAAALLFTVGLIVGAYLAETVISNIVPMIILASLLALSLALILIFRYCRCRQS